MRRLALAGSAFSVKAAEWNWANDTCRPRALHVRVPILLTSAAAWILLSVERNGTRLADHCAVPMLGAMPSSPSLDAVIAFNPHAWLTVGWALMLTAMMGPLLIAPVRHVHNRSFASGVRAPSCCSWQDMRLSG